MYAILSQLSSSLSDYLRRTFRLEDDLVSIRPLNNETLSATSGRIYLTLVNIERETSQGIRFGKSHASESHSQKTAPSWMLNLYVLFSAIFPEKQYEDSLQMLSATCLYLQSHHHQTIQQSGYSFSIEPVNLPFNELSNLWGVLGGSYHPSLLCKVRLVNLDAAEIRQLQTLISRKEVQT